MNGVVKSQIRMSDAMHARIMRIANETGDSMNGTMLHLIHLGLKLYETPVSVQASDSPGTSTGPCSAS